MNDSNSKEVAFEIAARTGWNQKTILDLAFQFIDSIDDSGDFEEFLLDLEQEEMEEDDSEELFDEE